MKIPGKLDKNIKKKGKSYLWLTRTYRGKNLFSSANLDPTTWSKMDDNQLSFIEVTLFKREKKTPMKLKIPKYMYVALIFYCLLLPALVFLPLFSLWYWKWDGNLLKAIGLTLLVVFVIFLAVGIVLHEINEAKRIEKETKPEYYILNNYNKTKFEQTLDYMVNKYWWFWYYYEKTYLYWRVMHSEFIINALRTRINNKSAFDDKLFAAVCRLALFIRLSEHEVKFLRSICIDNIRDKTIKPIPYQELAKIMAERFKSEDVNGRFKVNVELFNIYFT